MNVVYMEVPAATGPSEDSQTQPCQLQMPKVPYPCRSGSKFTAPLSPERHLFGNSNLRHLSSDLKPVSCKRKSSALAWARRYPNDLRRVSASLVRVGVFSFGPGLFFYGDLSSVIIFGQTRSSS